MSRIDLDKWLEDFFEHVRRNPNAGVRYSNEYLRLARISRFDANAAAMPGELECIRQEVEEDLLNLLAVRRGDEIGRDRRFEAETLRFDLRLHHG